jgi:hypothetical protein
MILLNPEIFFEILLFYYFQSYTQTPDSQERIDNYLY